MDKQSNSRMMTINKHDYGRMMTINKLDYVKVMIIMSYYDNEVIKML